MNSLKECIINEIPIADKELNSILASFEAKEVTKGTHLLEAGKNCHELIYIESGYVRMYSLANGKEVTFWIAGSGKFVTSLTSFIFQSDNFWNIQTITDCNIFSLKRQKHFDLTKKFTKWLEFDNILLARSFALLEGRMFSQLHTTALQRLQNLLQQEPQLFQYVPLQYIASYLGITPESLSRLRKKISQPIS